MLRLEALSVMLGGRRILHDLDLTLAAGQLTSIVGPSGSGKSTLLRAITGEIPYRGSALLNGQEVARMAPAQLARARAVLPQDTQVSFAFTVAEVVAMGGFQGPPAAPHRIEELLETVGLGGKGGRLVQSLSGGERQRVHLARVLLQAGAPIGPEGPRWLFLDEPVSSLDIAHQLSVMRIARAFADQGGAVVAVMHDLNLAAMFSDQIAVLAAGRIIAQGRPEAVITAEMITTVYGCKIGVCEAPLKGPWLLVQTAQ